jgi:hypothetical protein
MTGHLSLVKTYFGRIAVAQTLVADFPAHDLREEK